MESGYHRECYKPFTGLMKKYFTPTSSEKNFIEQNSVSTSIENFSATISLKPDLIIEQSHSQPLCTEYLPISEATSISLSTEQQPSTSQKNIDISEVGKVSEHNDSALEINIPNENDTNSEGYDVVCLFWDKKKNYDQKCFYFMKLKKSILNLALHLL